jgi:hypothetical protein
VRPRTVDAAVVGLVVDDDRVPGVAQPRDVVGGVVDVAVGLDFGLLTEEAQVPVRDAGVVEPRHRVGHRHRVTPVGVQAVGDQPDPDPRVGEAPEHVGHAFVDRHVPEHAVLEDPLAVVLEEGVVVEAPLVVVPAGLRRERRGVDPALGGHDPAERLGVVPADPVEVDAEDEPVRVGHAGACIVRWRRGTRGWRR